MGKSQRRKGHDYERRLVNVFKVTLPGEEIKRGLQSRDGSECPDVDVGGWLWVEAKRGKKPNVRAALKQAREACPRGRWRAAVIRDDREKAFVAMPLDDYLDLLKELVELRGRVRR